MPPSWTIGGSSARLTFWQRKITKQKFMRYGYKYRYGYGYGYGRKKVKPAGQVLLPLVVNEDAIWFPFPPRLCHGAQQPPMTHGLHCSASTPAALVVNFAILQGVCRATFFGLLLYCLTPTAATLLDAHCLGAGVPFQRQKNPAVILYNHHLVIAGDAF